jgi:hypothetical protein
MTYTFHFPDGTTKTLEGETPFKALRSKYEAGTAFGELFVRLKDCDDWKKVKWEPASSTAGKVGE